MNPCLSPVAITAYQCVSAGGDDIETFYQNLVTNQSCLAPLSLFDIPFQTIVGEVRSPLPDIKPELKAYDCRNARLALKALNTGGFREKVETAIAQYGNHRVGVILGTSTSGIYDTENAYISMLQTGFMPSDFEFFKTHTAQATAEFIKLELGLTGVCYAISTACSSSAKALAVAQRLLLSNACDAVLVAGVDSLCRLTLRGFNSLQLVAAENCRPMDAQRCGINIGEAAALLLVERLHEHNQQQPRLLAVGESSDAHHMTAPHPEGLGAARAMSNALQLAGRELDDVDYINLHATASPLNDQAEANAIRQLFPKPHPCSGIKGLIGHTLGAAGAVEVIACLIALEQQFLLGTCGLQQLDASISLPVLHQPMLNQAIKLVLSNAFGFGGNNASVLLEKP